MRPSDPCSSLPTTKTTLDADVFASGATDDMTVFASMTSEECFTDPSAPDQTIAGAAAAELMRAASRVDTNFIGVVLGHWQCSLFGKAVYYSSTAAAAGYVFV